MACNHDCGNCSANCSKDKNVLFPSNPENKIKKIIGVVSGKGGVGKSMVTSLLATSLAKMGKKVGILDADITGPSIPKAFGVEPGIEGTDKLLFPNVTKKYGIKVMSINLLMEDPEAPVLWRGPIISSALRQFYSETLWGELDYLLIDMPPGTADVAITIFQSIPIDGVIIVSTPQDLVKMIVGKAVGMCNQVGIKILGLVENMAYLTCPCCNNPIYPFGTSKVVEVSKHFDITPLISLPINPNLANLVDNGLIENENVKEFDELANKLDLLEL